MADWEKNTFRPFCSARCKMFDLGDWASEKYKIESLDSSLKQKPDDDDGEDP